MQIMVASTIDAIDKVELLRSHVPIRTANATANPTLQTTGLILWSREKPKPTPATLRMSEPSVQLAIWIKHHPLWAGCRVQLTSGLDIRRQPDLHSEWQHVSEENKERIRILVSISATKAPWGFNDLYHFRLWYEGQANVTIEPIPLEIYGVHESLPPYYDMQGIPLPLLRIFLGKTMQGKLLSEQDWIEWVTKVCHGSLDPNTGNIQSTSDYSMKYNVWVGLGSFTTSEWGGCFDLDAWLKAREDSLEGKGYTLINCYDQSGIIQVVLSLGMKYDRLIWEYIQPYGYIAPAELVGWGRCNNPLFRGDQSKQMLKEDQDCDRTSFTHHVCISKGGKPDKYEFPTTEKDWEDSEEIYEVDPTRHIIDTCAGPHLATRNRNNYMKAAVEKSVNGIQWNSWTVGITRLGHEGQAPFKLETQFFDEGAKRMESYKMFMHIEANQEPKKVVANFPVILKSFVGSVRKVYESEFPNGVVKSNTIQPQLGYAGSICEEKLWVESEDFASLTYIKISVLTTYHQANLSLLDRASTFMHRDKEEVFLTINESNAIGQISITTKEIGNNQVILFVYHNVFVEIGSWLGSARVESFAQLIEQELMTRNIDLVLEMDLTKPIILIPASAKVNDPVSMKVKAPGADLVRYLDTPNTHYVAESNRGSSSDDVWLFEFIPLGASEETLTFFCQDRRTKYVQTISQGITII